MAAALVGDAKGSCTGGQYCRPGRPACAGALLRRLGPDAADCSPGQNTIGPILQDVGGTEWGRVGKNRGKEGRGRRWALRICLGDLSVEAIGGFGS